MTLFNRGDAKALRKNIKKSAARTFSDQNIKIMNLQTC